MKNSLPEQTTTDGSTLLNDTCEIDSCGFGLKSAKLMLFCLSQLQRMSLASEPDVTVAIVFSF